MLVKKPREVLILFISFPSLHSLQSSAHPHGGGEEGAVVRELPHRAALPGHGRHHDRERQLWPHRRQDLRRGPGADGEHAVLPTRRVQDHVSEVRTGNNFTGRRFNLSVTNNKLLQSK